MSLPESLNPWMEGILASGRWLRVVNLLCLAGLATAALSTMAHWAGSLDARAGRPPRRNPFSVLSVVVLVLAIAGSVVSAWWRSIEVNHFPSQTMGEVLVMFSTALLVSMLVLHYALKLGRLGPGWATVDDALLALVFAGAWATNHYSTTLSTAQRDLPPALQSYWFPPHLATLIFSYATLGIAALFCAVYFAVRFWSGATVGGRSRRSQLLVLALLVLVPFAHAVTIPVLVVVGLVFLSLKLLGNLPRRETMDGFERTMDQVSYRAFTVGMPFLTAGLFFGAFWAQESWANYWGWDSKENSALITWLVYVGYVHLRMLGGYRGEKAMAVLMGGALSIFITFQIFGYLPDSQKSLHRYTDDGVTPREGRQGGTPIAESARLQEPEGVEVPADRASAGGTNGR